MLSRRVFTGACAAAFARLVAGAQASSTPRPAPGYSFQFEWIEQGFSGKGAIASVDLGSLAAQQGSHRARRILAQRRVMVRIDGPSANARVSLALLAETPGCSVRADGVLLSSVPRVLYPFHRVGAAVAHVIDIEIPPNVPHGPFLTNLQWMAEPG